MNPSIYPKIVPASTFDRIMEYEFLPASGRNKKIIRSQDFVNAAGDDFSNAIGKRIFCLAQGLSGEDKKMCERQILVQCGRRPLFLAKAAVKRRWSDCAKGVEYKPAITPTTADAGSAGTTGDAGTGGSAAYPKTADAGMPDWAKYLLIGGAALAVIGGSIFIIKKVKGAKMQPATVSAK